MIAGSNKHRNRRQPAKLVSDQLSGVPAQTFPLIQIAGDSHRVNLSLDCEVNSALERFPQCVPAEAGNRRRQTSPGKGRVQVKIGKVKDPVAQRMHHLSIDATAIQAGGPVEVKPNSLVTASITHAQDLSTRLGR